MKTFSDLAAFYLPGKYRRWFVYIPVNFALLLLVAFGVICWKASSVKASSYFQANAVGDDVDLQFKHLQNVLNRYASTGQLDVAGGYSEICGYSSEWNAGFWIFYSLALRELALVQPSRLDEIRPQLDLAARAILRLPPRSTDQEVKTECEKHPHVAGALQAGYNGIVLAARKMVVGDALFDRPLLNNAHFLADEINRNLDHTSQVWTSDQVTQLYAIWLADQATGENHQPLFQRWRKVMTDRFIEKKTGLLCSEVGISPDRVISPPRSTSIAWTAFFLADVFPDFTRQQYTALCRLREQRFGNLNATREFGTRNPLQFGDTDSGPLILGFSPAATGFALCCHKIFGEPERFARTLRIFEVFGDPRRTPGGKFYHRGNAMGDAILLYAKVRRSNPRGQPIP